MKKERDRAIYKLPSSLTNKRFNGNRVGRVKTAEEELFSPPVSTPILIPAFMYS